MMAWLTKKRLFALHGWLGIILGLPLFIICLSGACAVMSPELDRMIHPQMRVVPPADPAARPLSWGTLLGNIADACPGGEVIFLDGAPERDAAWQATVAYSPKDQRLVFIDPFTGRVQGQTSTFTARSFFRIFHKQLYITGGSFWPHGRVIVCAFSIVLFLSAVTGLMFYKGWWKHLFRLRLGKGLRIFCSDLHRFAGVWSFLLAIMFSVTGFWYFLVRLMEDFGLAEHDPLPVIPAEVINTSPPSLRPLGLDELVARAQAAYPELEISGVSLGSRPGSGVGFYGKGPLGLSSEMSNLVFLDPYRGDLLAVSKAHELPLGARLESLADPIHFGRFGGYVTKFIWTAVGLALATGVLAGTILWWLRTRKDNPASFRRHRRWVMASLVLNMVILGIAAVSTYGFVGAQIKGPRQTRTGDFLGESEAGPWRVKAFRHGALGESGGSFSFQFPAEEDPNYRAAYCWSGDPVRPAGLKPLGGSRQRLFSTIAVSAGRLNLEIEGWDGTRSLAHFPVIGEGDGANLVPPPAPVVPLGLWLVTGGFLLVVLVPVGWWFGKARITNHQSDCASHGKG